MGSVDTTVTHTVMSLLITCATTPQQMHSEHVQRHTFTYTNAHSQTKRLTGVHRCTRKRNHHYYTTRGAYGPLRAITWHLLTAFDIWLVTMVHYLTWRWQINNYSVEKTFLFVWRWWVMVEEVEKNLYSKSLNRKGNKGKCITHLVSEGIKSMCWLKHE